jgi:hypothetical protein
VDRQIENKDLDILRANATQKRQNADESRPFSAVSFDFEIMVRGVGVCFTSDHVPHVCGVKCSLRRVSRFVHRSRFRLNMMMLCTI